MLGQMSFQDTNGNSSQDSAVTTFWPYMHHICTGQGGGGSTGAWETYPCLHFQNGVVLPPPATINCESSPIRGWGLENTTCSLYVVHDIFIYWTVLNYNVFMVFEQKKPSKGHKCSLKPSTGLRISSVRQSWNIYKAGRLKAIFSVCVQN